MESNYEDMQDYVDDFWNTFDAEEKAELKLKGFEKLSNEVIFIDFKSKKILSRKFA